MNCRSLLCACATAAAMMIPVVANTPASTKTNVPFAFEASGKTMAAGQYVFAKNSENVLSVRHENGDAALAVVTRHVGATNGAAQPKLIFIRKNGKLHLSEVYLPNAPGGEQIPVK